MFIANSMNLRGSPFHVLSVSCLLLISLSVCACASENSFRRRLSSDVVSEGAQPQVQTTTSTAAATTTPHVRASSAAATQPQGADPEIEVLEVAFAVGVSSLMPVGREIAFDASVGQVFFWNRLKVRHPPQRIRHIWYRDNEKIGESRLSLRYSLTRAWTRRKIRPGQWKVEIADQDGNILMVALFPVTAAAGVSTQR